MEATLEVDSIGFNDYIQYLFLILDIVSCENLMNS